MTAQNDKRDSISGLRFDLITAKVLVWVATVGREADLTSEAHIYFFDRYQRLAEYHRQRGHDSRARRLQCKADEHLAPGGGDGPRYAAAMGMPRPRHWVQRARRRGIGRDCPVHFCPLPCLLPFTFLLFPFFFHMARISLSPCM